MIHELRPGVPRHEVVGFFGKPGVTEHHPVIEDGFNSYQKAFSGPVSVSGVVGHGFVSNRASGSILAGFGRVHVCRPGFGLGGFFSAINP